jgi:putative glutamine amidotransferase
MNEILKPIIGMPVQRIVRGAVFSQSPEYSWSVEQAGGVPLLIPLIVDVLPLARLCHGFIITGSYADVDPALYGAQTPDDNYSDTARDRVDYQLLKYAEETGKPVFGVCRGCQVMNVFRGGTLAQQFSDLVSTDIEHNGEPEDLEVHRLTLVGGANLQSSLNRTELPVNSLHRQVVSRVAPTLMAAAISEDGLTEAIEDKINPKRYYAVQWHPELLAVAGDAAAQKIFSDFVDECRHAASVSNATGSQN